MSMACSRDGRLAAFDRHRDQLLAMLREACERRPRTISFDAAEAWRCVRFMASVYLDEAARTDQERERRPDECREILHQLAAALEESRSKLDRATDHDVRGSLFLAWCQTHGDPDLTGPVIGAFERGFDKEVAAAIAGLATFERCAVVAAEEFRRRSGRPDGRGVLPQDFVVRLEYVYQGLTGKAGGRGYGPFARFTAKFLEAALQRDITLASVVGAIKDAKITKKQ
jgi:hypothetical protein